MNILSITGYPDSAAAGAESIRERVAALCQGRKKTVVTVVPPAMASTFLRADARRSSGKKSSSRRVVKMPNTGSSVRSRAMAASIWSGGRARLSLWITPASPSGENSARTSD